MAQNRSSFDRESTKYRRKQLLAVQLHTVKVGHNSDLKCAKRRVETCTPVPVIVELEQTL